MEEVKDLLKRLIEEKSLEFFTSKEGLGLAVVKEETGCYTFNISSNQFKNYVYDYASRLDGSFSKHKLDVLLELIESKAFRSKQSTKAFIRVGRVDDTVYVDLNNELNSIVKIDESGWSIEQNDEVHFLRLNKQLALPDPVECSNEQFVKEFKKIFNLKNDKEWILILAVMIKALNYDRGAYPILLLEGLQVSGKTLTSKRIKALIDPTMPPLSSPPKDAMDIKVLANSSYFLCFDNISYMNAEMADIWCRISTGGGIYSRKLYSDDDMKVYDIQRPTLINGIDEPTVRPDFLERCVILEMNPLSIENRKGESELDKQFAEVYPRLLGGVYSLFSEVLEILPEIQTEKLPRMTEYARIGIALEKILKFEEGYFLKVYESNQTELSLSSFWEDPVCCAIYEILKIAKDGEFLGGNMKKTFASRGYKPNSLTGTPSQILQKLLTHGGRNPSTKLPISNSAALSRFLKRKEPILNKMGIYVERIRTANERIISITLVELIEKKKEVELDN